MSVWNWVLAVGSGLLIVLAILGLIFEVDHARALAVGLILGLTVCVVRITWTSLDMRDRRQEILNRCAHAGYRWVTVNGMYADCLSGDDTMWLKVDS